jgi:hypothetical protein
MCIFTQSDWLNKQSNENLPENGNNSDYSSIQELSSVEIEIEGKTIIYFHTESQRCPD